MKVITAEFNTMNTLNADQYQASEHVLTKAVLRIASMYGLSHKSLSQIIGASDATVSRLFSGARTIKPHSKEGELAILLVRLFRSLSAMLGDNHQQAVQWLTSYHHVFQQTPLEHIQHIAGLMDTVNYLDAMRGKL